MIVVGGSYQETISIPAFNRYAGSGIRAAAALRGVTVSLVTAIDDQAAPMAQTVAATLGFSMTANARDRPVAFRYTTPMSTPSVEGRSAICNQPLVADDEVVLAFGMVERVDRRVRCRRAVIDPQQPRELGPGLNLNGIQHDELAIVANVREIHALAGQDRDIAASAQTVAARSNAHAVIVKNSALGCIVWSKEHPERTHHIGPFPTETVFPLGSGDIFAAAFAHAWGKGADPVEAARIASASAAWWCATTVSAVPLEILSGSSPSTILPSISAEFEPAAAAPSVYLAGPFFTVAELWLIETCRDALFGLGARVFSPFHDVGPGGDEVATKDLAGLERSGAVLALLDHWDPGTVYEVGWAHGKGVPVIGLRSDLQHDGTKMLIGSGAEVHDDLSSALYRCVWAAQGNTVSAARITAQRR